MTTKTYESGLLLDLFPYIRIGNGPRPLLVIPGAEVDNAEPGRIIMQSMRIGFARFAREHTVYIVNRRRALPTGYTTRDMAADYVRVLEAIGPAHVMGFSTGGLIAQHVAALAPELIDRLVLVVTGARLSDNGRRLAEHWRQLASDDRWIELVTAMSETLVVGATGKRLLRGYMRLFGPLIVKPPQYPADFVVTMNAVLLHDTTALLPTLRTPTLLIGGSLDPFFSTSLLQETAALIPDAELNVYEGAGHGLMKRHKRRFENDVLRFLSPTIAPVWHSA